MTTLDPTATALAAVQRAVDSAVTDYHERCFREQLKRDPELARIAQRPVVRVFEDEQQDAAEHFAEQMSPSEGAFR
jgi:hypothetical protein